MFAEFSQNLVFVAVGAFLLGWILSAIASRLGSGGRVSKRDPRDSRIRELEAELRIARSDSDRSVVNFEKLEDELKETVASLERRDNVISDQQAKIRSVTDDLKDSVLKTRELRAELANRAAETVAGRSENSRG